MAGTSNPLRRKRLSALAGLLLGALATLPAPASAQREMPQNLPERPRVPAYDPGLPVDRKELKNGVVLLVQEQRTSDEVAATVALRMGTEYEDDLNAGLSQVLMRALTSGTQALKPTELQLRFIAHKVEMHGGASADYGQLEMKTIREEAEPALDLLADVVLTPSFPDTAVENAKIEYMKEASNDVESPLPATYTMFLKAMYPGSPFGRPPHGTVQAIDEAHRSDIVALYRKFFVGSNLVVAVVGNVDGKKVMAQLERRFAAAPAGPAPKAVGADPAPLAADTTITATRPYLARSLVYGFAAPGYADPDYPAFMIIDSYLRSGDRSPIAYWLPELQIAVGVGIIYPTYPRRSSIAVYMGTAPSNFEAARDTVVNVFDRIKTYPFDKGEWGVQLKRAQDGFLFNQRDPMVRARNLSRWTIQGLTLDFPKEFETRLLKLTPEMVREAATRWFTHSCLVSLEPAKRDVKP
ncbi:MAG: M16 family metallopeptidase [Hyphomicrobiales bacterium]